MNHSEKKTRVIIMLIILQYWYRLRYKVLEREDTGKKTGNIYKRKVR